MISRQITDDLWDSRLVTWICHHVFTNLSQIVGVRCSSENLNYLRHQNAVEVKPVALNRSCSSEKQRTRNDGVRMKRRQTLSKSSRRLLRSENGLTSSALTARRVGESSPCDRRNNWHVRCEALLHPLRLWRCDFVDSIQWPFGHFRNGFLAKSTTMRKPTSS